MTAKEKVFRRDRWADWAVLGVVLVALLLGLLLRYVTLYRTERFAFDNLGISGRAPAAWVRQYAEDPLLQVRNPLSGGFSTIIELRNRPLAEDADLVLALDALALERASEVETYRTLEVTEVMVEGEPATQRIYTYVDVDHNPYVDRLPVVVRGVDVALRDGGRAIIVSFIADAELFDAHYRYFRTFVEGLDFEVVR